LHAQGSQGIQCNLELSGSLDGEKARKSQDTHIFSAIAVKRANFCAKIALFQVGKWSDRKKSGELWMSPVSFRSISNFMGGMHRLEELFKRLMKKCGYGDPSRG
jgi:hypothetical protein